MSFLKILGYPLGNSEIYGKTKKVNYQKTKGQYISIYKINEKYSVRTIFSHFFEKKPKSQIGFGKWTFLKMSKNEKANDFPENAKFVTIKKFYRKATKNFIKKLLP